MDTVAPTPPVEVSPPEAIPPPLAPQVAGTGDSVLVLHHLQNFFRVRSKLFAPPLSVRAVDDVTLAIRKGETVAIVGESGSGKTTLGRTAIRLLEPTGGQILYDGQDITHTKMKRLMWLRRKTQIIPQDPYASVNPAYTVFRILEEPLVVHGVGTTAERAERVRQRLEAVKLTPPEVFEPKFPHMLSGGQRQRVAVARAMILDPELIIADEPVSMLDASVRVSILELLSQIQEEMRVAFMYITHDLATARHFSDRIAVMYAGKVVELGPVGPVLNEPLHPYTQSLMAASPDPDPENRFRKIAALPGEPPSLISPPSGCRFHPRCPIAKAGLCEVLEPPLRELRPGHFVACHLAV